MLAIFRLYMDLSSSYTFFGPLFPLQTRVVYSSVWQTKFHTHTEASVKLYMCFIKCVYVFLNWILEDSKL